MALTVPSTPPKMSVVRTTIVVWARCARAGDRGGVILDRVNPYAPKGFMHSTRSPHRSRRKYLSLRSEAIPTIGPVGRPPKTRRRLIRTQKHHHRRRPASNHLSSHRWPHGPSTAAWGRCVDRLRPQLFPSGSGEGRRNRPELVGRDAGPISRVMGTRAEEDRMGIVHSSYKGGGSHVERIAGATSHSDSHPPKRAKVIEDVVGIKVRWTIECPRCRRAPSEPDGGARRATATNCPRARTAARRAP